MTYSYAQALALVGVPVPAHLQAQAAVPVLTGVQAQGDLLVVPVGQAPDDVHWQPVPASGVALTTSAATGNTHWLHQGQGSTGVRWAPAVAAEPTEDDDAWDTWLGADEREQAEVERLRVAWLEVPDGQLALLIHTDEHGANGIGPGTYVVHRKREADEEYRDRLLAD